MAAGAAKWAAENLGKDKDAWERLVFMFAQREQLPALGEHVPVSPRLSQLAYTAVASAYVPQEQNHAELARLLHRWPQPLLSDIAEELTQIISHRIQNSHGPPSVAIQRSLARLLDVQARLPPPSCWPYGVLAVAFRYTQVFSNRKTEQQPSCYVTQEYTRMPPMQKEYKRALDIWLSIADPCVFDHINHHPELYDAAGRGAAQLMVVDADRAIDMLVEHHDKVHADDVIAQLRSRLDSAPREDVPQWRQRLCRYLHALFLKDRRAPHSFHDLQARCPCSPPVLLYRSATKL